MSFDFSSLSSDPLFYFLAHSTLFVVIIASVFFTFGLAFGWFTWARYKAQRRDLLSERDALKDEIVNLKRKLAELASRAPSLAEASPSADSAPLRPAHAEPDPVINSFLSTAAVILPQVAKPDVPQFKETPPLEGAPETQVAPTLTPPAEPLPIQPPTAPTKPRKPSITSRVKPKKHVLQSLIHNETGHDLIDHAGGDRALPHISHSLDVPVSEPAAEIFTPPSFVATEPLPAQPVEVPSTPPHPDSIAASSDIRLVSDPHLGLVYATRPGLSDDLSHLKGVASVIERKLNDYGVYTFKQIALWSEENIREFSQLLAFKDRIHREQWVEQARELHFQKYGERL